MVIPNLNKKSLCPLCKENAWQIWLSGGNKDSEYCSYKCLKCNSFTFIKSRKKISNTLIDFDLEGVVDEARFNLEDYFVSIYYYNSKSLISSNNTSLYINSIIDIDFNNTSLKEILAKIKKYIIFS